MSNITLNVGDTFTTQRSGETVKALEIVKNPNGSARVRVQRPNGAERWTTVSNLK